MLSFFINKKNYTNEDALVMIEMYKNQERPTDIVKKFNINAQTLYRILHKNNIKFDSRRSSYKHSFDERTRLKKIIINSKKTNLELSKELNLSQEHIGKVKNNKRWEHIIL